MKGVTLRKITKEYGPSNFRGGRKVALSAYKLVLMWLRLFQAASEAYAAYDTDRASAEKAEAARRKIEGVEALRDIILPLCKEGKNRTLYNLFKEPVTLEGWGALLSAVGSASDKVPREATGSASVSRATTTAARLDIMGYEDDSYLDYLGRVSTSVNMQ